MIRPCRAPLALLLASAACLAIAVAEEAPAKKPHVVFVIGDGEYKSEQTLPALAKELEEKHGLRCTLCVDKNVGSDAWDPKPGQRSSDIPGLEALESADLAVFFLRFRTVPEDQAKRIQAYVDSGKPVAGFRTATHGFNYAKGDPLEPMNKFGPEVLGAPWIRHYGHKSSTDVSVIPEAAAHPILKGVDKSFHVRSWLYHIKPEYPPKDATPLLVGRAVDSEKPNPEENPVAWTRKTKAGGRVFMTTMGHPEDFLVPAFRRLAINGIHWALGRDVPGQAAPAAEPRVGAQHLSAEAPRGAKADASPLLQDGDRVVFVGNTFLERENTYGYIETMLMRLHPGKKIVFRNLAWSGDTVNVQMRPLNFGSLETHVAEQKPSLIVASFGMGESFEGEAGLPAFEKGLNETLDKLAKIQPRIILLSPIQHENLGPPYPDRKEHNRILQAVVNAMRRIAESRNVPFADLYANVRDGTKGGGDRPLTENGIHLSERGYHRAAQEVERLLALSVDWWDVSFDVTAQRIYTPTRAHLSDVQMSATGVRFTALDDMLSDRSVFSVQGLAPGEYSFKIDGRKVVTARADKWRVGIWFPNDSEQDPFGQLRKAILAKNRLWFHRWRDHNGEYIYGRRSKAFPGNAGNDQFVQEMAALDKLLREADEKIWKLSAPVPHTYELVPEK